MVLALLLGSWLGAAQGEVIFREDFEDVFTRSDGQATRRWDAERHRRDAGGSHPRSDRWPEVFKYSQMQSDRSGKVVGWFDSGIRPREGDACMRFTWEADRYDPADSNNTKKAHLWADWEPPSAQGQSRWFGFSIYLPEDEDGMTFDSHPEILVQWHGRPNQREYRGGNLIPPLALKLDGEEVTLEWWFDAQETTIKPTFGGKIRDPAGAVRDRWVDWLLKVRWHPQGQGTLQVYRRIVGPPYIYRWDRLLDRQNISIGYNDRMDPHLGVGLYKYSARSDHSRRVVYFDHVIIASTRGEAALR